MIYSIIIPVYNTEKYLNECVESIINQDYPYFEIILVNDGSTDSSASMCDAWACRDSRIVALHQNNAGAAAARNAGINIAKGDYFLFLDSDDYWLNNHVLSNINDRLSRSAVDVLIYNYQKDYGNRLDAPYFNELNRGFLSEYLREPLEQIIANHLWTSSAWNKAVKSSMFRNGEMRFHEGQTAEDIEWNGRLAFGAADFDYLDISVLGYRQRESSVTGTMTKRKIQCLADSVQQCARLAMLADGARRRLLETYTAFQYATLLYGYSLLSSSEGNNEVLEELRSFEYLLCLSDHPKVKQIYWAKSIFGLRLTLKLLHLRAAMHSFYHKRSD